MADPQKPADPAGIYPPQTFREALGEEAKKVANDDNREEEIAKWIVAHPASSFMGGPPLSPEEVKARIAASLPPQAYWDALTQFTHDHKHDPDWEKERVEWHHTHHASDYKKEAPATAPATTAPATTPATRPAATHPSPPTPKSLEEYAELAQGANYMKHLAETFGPKVAADHAVSVYSLDNKHYGIANGMADAYWQDMREVMDSKKTDKERNAFRKQVVETFGTQGEQVGKALDEYYATGQNATSGEFKQSAFVREVSIANVEAYRSRAQNRTHGIVDVRVSPELAHAAMGSNIELDKEILAYIAARDAQNNGQNVLFSDLRKLASNRVEGDLKTRLEGLSATELKQAAQAAIKAGVKISDPEMQIINDKATDPKIIRQILLSEDTKFLLNEAGHADLPTILKELVPPLPTPAAKPAKPKDGIERI